MKHRRIKSFKWSSTTLIQKVLINNMETYDNGVLKEQVEGQNLRHLVSGLFVAVSTAGDRIMELILSEPVRAAFHHKKESLMMHAEEKINIPKSFHLITEEIMPKNSKPSKNDDASNHEWQKIMQVLLKDIHREVKNRFRYEEYEMIPCLIDWSMKVVGSSWDPKKEIFVLQPRHLLASFYSEILKAIDCQHNAREIGSLLQIFELPMNDEIYENHLNFCLRVTQSINLHKLKSMVNTQAPLVTQFMEGRDLQVSKNDRAVEIKYILLKALGLLDFSSVQFSGKIELMVASLCKVLIDFDQRAKMGLDMVSVDGDNVSTYKENARCRTPENVSYLLLQLLKTNRLQAHYSQLIFALLTQRASVNASILTLIDELEQSKNKLSWLVTDRIIRLKLLACLSSDSTETLSSLVGDFQISVTNSLSTGNTLMLKISLKYIKDIIQPWGSEHYKLISIVVSGLFKMFLSNTSDSADSQAAHSFPEDAFKKKKGSVQKIPAPEPPRLVHGDLRFIYILPLITEILDRLSSDPGAYDRIRQENLTNFMRAVLISVIEAELSEPAQAATESFYMHVPPLSVSASKTYTNYILVSPSSNDTNLKEALQKPLRNELKQKYQEKSRIVDSTNFGELLYLVCVSRVLSIKTKLFNLLSNSTTSSQKPEALISHMLEYLDNPSLYTRELDNYRALLETIVIKNIQKYQSTLRDSLSLSVKCKAHADDFVALLHFMCSINRRLASKAKELAKETISSFPLMILESDVLQSGIRLLEFLDECLSSQFKSISSRLKCRNISTLLPVNVKDIQESIIWIASSLLRLFFLNLLAPNDSLKTVVRQIALGYFSSDSKNSDNSGIGSGFVNFMLMVRLPPSEVLPTSSIAQILTQPFKFYEKIKPETIMQKVKNPFVKDLLLENPKVDFNSVKSSFSIGLPIETKKLSNIGFPGSPLLKTMFPGQQGHSKVPKKPESSGMASIIIEEISHSVQMINFTETIMQSEDLIEKLLEQPACKDALLRFDPLLRGTIQAQDSKQSIEERMLLIGQEKKRELFNQILLLFQLIDSSQVACELEVLGKLQCTLSKLSHSSIWKEILHGIFLNAHIQHKISLESLISFVLESLKATLVVLSQSTMHSSFTEESMMMIRSSLFTAGYQESWISTCLSLYGRLLSDSRPGHLTPHLMKSFEKILFYQLLFYSDHLPTLNVNSDRNLTHFSKFFTIIRMVPIKIIPMLSLRNTSLFVNIALETLVLHQWAQLPTNKLEHFIVSLILHQDSLHNEGLFKKNSYSQKNKSQIEFCLKLMTRNYSMIASCPSLKYHISTKVYTKLSRKDEQTRPLERVLPRNLVFSKSGLFSDSFEKNKHKRPSPGIVPLETKDVEMKVEVLLALAGEIENMKALFITEFGGFQSSFRADSLVFSEPDREKICRRLVTVSRMAFQSFYLKFQHAFPKTFAKSTWGSSLVIDSLSQVLTQPHLLNWNFEAIVQSEEFKTSQLFYCNPPSISTLLQHTGPDYSDNEFALDFVTKTLQRLTSRQLAFYLTEVYQSLSGKKYIQFANILQKFAETSPLVYHQLIWMAKVESKMDPSERVTPGTLQKCEVSMKFHSKLYKALSAQDREYFFLEDNFIEQITAISGMLKPKMEAGEKFSIIRKELERIVIPPGVYLPTNPFFQVIRIKTDSGTPMQSAARCPIKVAFDCKRFEGPDKYLSKIKNTLAAFPINEKETDLAVDDEEEENKGVNNVKEMLCKSMAFAKTNSIRKSANSILDNSNLPSLKPALSGNEHPSHGQNIFSYEELAAQSDLMSSNVFQKPKKTNRRDFYNESVIVSRKKVFTSSEHENMVNGGDPSESPVIEKASLIQSNIRKEWKEEKAEREKEEIVDCIFKVHDDIRQDSLALQIIHLFHDIFQQVGLDLYLFPYRTISNRTGPDMDIGGLIEVVPNTSSRDQIGKLNEYSLYDYFTSKFGSE